LSFPRKRESASVFVVAFAFFVCHSEAKRAESASVFVVAFAFVCHSEAKRAESAFFALAGIV
jgi:hypothetical protein